MDASVTSLPRNEPKHADAARALAPRVTTCWGLSSFCAESGHKCRAVGKCIFTPPSNDSHGVPPATGEQQ